MTSSPVSRALPTAHQPIASTTGHATPPWYQFWTTKDNPDPITAARIADKDDDINLKGKIQGKVVFDTTNNRLMVAEDGAATDKWWVVDGSASVTPA